MVTGAGILAVVILVGCGGQEARSADPPAGRTLEGAEVASMAEHRLEVENPSMAHGTMRCPDLDLRIGESVRCLRTVRLGDGRVVKVRGTVSVTSHTGGGRLHVAMDPDVTEFGVSGDRVARALRGHYAKRHARVRDATCPYLRGEVGASVSCRFVVRGERRSAEAVVTAVDAATYRTSFRFAG